MRQHLKACITCLLFSSICTTIFLSFLLRLLVIGPRSLLYYVHKVLLISFAHKKVMTIKREMSSLNRVTLKHLNAEKDLEKKDIFCIFVERCVLLLLAANEANL